jgi:predicted DNA-binding transcriptional regulator AlpA
MSQTTIRLLTEAEAAQYLGVSRQFLRKSRMDGKREGHADAPPWVQAGRMIRYAIDDLDEWIEAHRQTGRL